LVIFHFLLLDVVPELVALLDVVFGVVERETLGVCLVVGWLLDDLVGCVCVLGCCVCVLEL